MIDSVVPPEVEHSETDPAVSGGRTFRQWLDAQLRARNLTQRQLAQKSGVDHSTICRLLRGGRAPSLRTAALLARGLGMEDSLGWLDRQTLGRAACPASRVEHALRLDDLLGEAQVREIMNVYLAARLRCPRGTTTPVPGAIRATAPVPIAVHTSGVRPRSASDARARATAIGRSR
jgi:transcriptional regulator with XRE-family HTH domain